MYRHRVAALSERDYLGILDVVCAAAVGTIDEPMPDAALLAVQRLLSADTVGYFRGAPWDRQRRQIWVAGGCREFPLPIVEAMHAFRHQNPLTPSPATLGRAVMTSDYLDRRAYHRLDLYNTVGRPLGIEASMEFWFQPPGGPVEGLTLDSGRLAFSERDRNVLDVLGQQLIRLARARAEARTTHAAARLSRREAEVLEMVARGGTNADVARRLGISPTTVRTHLENAFAKLGVHTRSAAVMAAFNGTSPHSLGTRPGSAAPTGP